ncbi:MAG: response regulator [Verrucomicrobiota bacterium]
MISGRQEIIILVVDDDSSMSQAIERLLAAAGWRARSFASAEELLMSGMAAGATLLIVDLQLPGMTGLELIARLAAGGPVPPVIIITAQDRPGTRELVRKSGAAACLTKPFAGQDLIQAVRRHLPAA